MRFLLLAIVLYLGSCKTPQNNLSTTELNDIDPKQNALDVIDAIIKIAANKTDKIKINATGSKLFTGPQDLQPSLDKIDAVFKWAESEDFNYANYLEFLNTIRSELPKSLYPYAFMRNINGADQIEVEAQLFCAVVLESFIMIVSTTSVSEFFEPELAKNYLNQLVTQKIQGVSYNGVAGRHSYDNQPLKFAVNYLANATIVAPKIISDIVAALPKEQYELLKLETNDQDGVSRIEASDLLISELKHLIIELAEKEPSINMPSAGNLAQSIFQRVILNDKASTMPQHAILRNGLIDNSPSLICAAMGQATLKISEDYATEMLELEGEELFKILPLEKIWAMGRSYTGKNQKLELQCGSKAFALNLKVTERPEIKRPVLKFNGDLHAISSVALVREMSVTMFTASLGYLVANGYIPIRIAHTDQLKKDFMDLATDARLDRVVLPVGHEFSRRGTELGSAAGTKVVAMKKVGKRTIYLHVFLPPFSPSLNKEGIEIDDMKAILCSTGHCEGLEGEANTVAVMTTSCHSAGTIDTWMTAFITAMDNPRKPRTPLVFASQEGFDTNNPFVIVSHLDHALRFTEGLANGLSSEQMNELLNKPLDYTYIRRIIEKAANLYQPKSNAKLQSNYKPACNIDQNAYFEGSFKLIDLDIVPIN